MNEPSAEIHIEHYFPKGYDPDSEPWKSIREHHAKLRAENERLKALSPEARRPGRRQQQTKERTI